MWQKEVILAHRNPRNEKGMARAKCLLRRMLREEKPSVASLGISIAEPGSIWQSTGATPFHVGIAVVESGTSDNVIGVDTLQDLTNLYEEMGFNISDEFEINRTKTFIYGGDHSSQAIGLAHLSVGILGTEIVLNVQIVDGGTPLLLSAKFLYDAKAKIDFRTGEASFGNISDQKNVHSRPQSRQPSFALHHYVWWPRSSSQSCAELCPRSCAECTEGRVTRLGTAPPRLKWTV